MIDETSVILAAAVAGFLAGGLVSAVLLWWARGRVERAIRKAEMRAVSGGLAAESRVSKLEAQLKGTRKQLEKLPAGAARENQNLVAILRGLTGSALRIEERLKELERKVR